MALGDFRLRGSRIMSASKQLAVALQTVSGRGPPWRRRSAIRRSHRQCPPERIAPQAPRFIRDAQASDETNAGTASRRQVVDQ